MSTEWSKQFRTASKNKDFAPGAFALGQNVPRRPRPLPATKSASGPDFGTSLTGDHSAHELYDLIRAKQSEIDDVTNHVANLAAHSDPAWTAWGADWHRFLMDWKGVSTEGMNLAQSAKGAVSGALQYLTPSFWVSSSSEPWDNTYVEDEYQKVLSVLQPGGAGTSRLQDLYRRYTQLPSATPVPFRPVPQPGAPDASLHALQQIQKLNLPANPLNLYKRIPWWVYAAGGVVVLGAGTMLLKNSPLGLLFKVMR